MRIAYLITAYDQPDHLFRLVSSLQSENCRFYIHVDGNVGIASFSALREREDTWLAADRVRVQWMGFSQVESILLLMRKACADGFDYCVLLSGSDYPIKSNRAIRDFYLHANEEYMTFWKLADRPSWPRKIEAWYPIDQIPIHGWVKNREPSYWRRLFWGRYYKYLHLLPRRRFPFDMEPYGGSDWWSLSEGCVRHILEFIDAHPSYSRFYRYTHCPSEMFFQTIVLNSRWAHRVRHWEAYQEWSKVTPHGAKLEERSMLSEEQFNFRYVDWNSERERPAILDERDWPALLTSPCLFARKFHPCLSHALLGQIDTARLEISGRPVQ